MCCRRSGGTRALPGAFFPLSGQGHGTLHFLRLSNLLRRRAAWDLCSVFYRLSLHNLRDGIEKHTIDGQRAREDESNQGIIVPLDVPEFEIVSQSLRADGSIEVQVKARNESAACPNCGKSSTKIHERRKRVKRDIPIRNHQVSLIVHKRRFRCATCRRPFTETDSACGR